MGKNRYLAVAGGFRTGIFRGGAWEKVKHFVHGYSGALFKGGTYEQSVYLLIKQEYWPANWYPPVNWSDIVDEALDNGLDLRVYDAGTMDVVETGYGCRKCDENDINIKISNRKLENPSEYKSNIKSFPLSRSKMNVEIFPIKTEDENKENSDYFRIKVEDPFDENIDANRDKLPQDKKSRGKYEKVAVWCDGSSLGNGKANPRAGLGVWFSHNDERNCYERVPGPIQTNNRGELLACIRAIEIINKTSGKYCPIEIHTDSEYVMKMVEILKYPTHRQYRNTDLLYRLVGSIQSRASVKFIHVRGHSGDEGNEEADKLAKMGAAMT